MSPILVDAPEAARLLQVSERHFHTLRKNPDFPAPRMLGQRSARWLVSELQDYVAGLPKASLPPTPFDGRALASTTPTRRNGAATV